MVRLDTLSFGGKEDKMARVLRSDEEARRVGIPSVRHRLDIVERLLSKLLALSTIPGGDTDRTALGEVKDRLDKLDIDFPDAR